MIAMALIPFMQLAVVITIVAAASTLVSITVVTVGFLFVPPAMAMPVIIVVMTVLRERNVGPGAQKQCHARKVKQFLGQHRFSSWECQKFQLTDRCACSQVTGVPERRWPNVLGTLALLA